MDGFGALFAVVAFVIGLVALRKITRLETALSLLRQQVTVLGTELDILRGTAPAMESTETAPAPQPAEAPVSGTEPLATEPAVQTREATETLPSQHWTGPAAAPSKSDDMERALASRWFVWIGGLAIAIGGLLFVKYAYDNGLVPPAVQILLGLLLGAGLVSTGEFLRRKSGAARDTGYVPAALSAAGLVTAFGSVYAAFALYGLISNTTAFAGLAVVALAALALSRLQGPLVAALGLIGSYGTPALIPSDQPSAWGLFTYLFVILAASFAALRGRTWWWLGHAAIAGGAAWALLWLKGPFMPGDIPPLGFFALATGFTGFFGLRGIASLTDEPTATEGRRLPPQTEIGLAGLGAQAILLSVLVHQSSHAALSLSLFALGMAMTILIAWRRPLLTPLAVAAAGLTLVVLMAWREAAFHVLVMDETGLWSSMAGGAAPQFLNWMLGAAVTITLIGAAGTWLRPRPEIWAGMGGASAFLFIFGAWSRVSVLLTDSLWALIAAVLAAGLLAVVWFGRARQAESATGLAWGLLSAGAAALLVFAADRRFDHLWLTLVIAALALGFAVLTVVMRVKLQAMLAVALATLSTIRLYVARELWFDDRSLPLGQHWPLYGYGVTAILFLAASRILKTAGHARAAVSLEGLSLGLAISLLSLEIRVLIGGGIAVDDPQLLEMSAHILSWLGAAFGLLYRQRLYSSVIATWGARVLLALSGMAMLAGPLTALNPVVSGEPLQGGLVFNTLLLAYLAPAILLLLIARRLDTISSLNLKPAAGVAALVLVFAYVTLETKRIFQGRLMMPESLSVAESYAYSAVWLTLALALFIAGLRLRRQYVRYAGLGVMVLVVLKVFLWDMSSLEGLYRIASFIGLGLCLVGIGWLYARFIQLPAAEKT